MTGINLDLFTVIIMLILAFMCGYSAGHRLGREEVRRFIIGSIAKMTGLMDKDALMKKGDDLKHE